MPADIAELFKNVENRGNVFVLILDSEGKFVHGFPANPPRRDPEYFRAEIAKAKVEFPKEHKKLGGLPDGKGVRLFIRSRSDLPIVEMAPMKDVFAYPDADREIDAAELREWFAHFYPPAIRTADQSKPYKTVTGKFKLRAAGADEKTRYAILGGEFRMTKGDDGDSAFEGSLGAVLTYAKDKPEMATLRGAVDGVYLYRQRGEQRIPLAAALESRP